MEDMANEWVRITLFVALLGIVIFVLTRKK